MAMPSAPLPLVLLLLWETLTMAESSTKLLTIALLSSTFSTMVEATTNNGGDITSESFVYSREFRAIMGRVPFHISMIKEEYTENATFPWFCGSLFPLGGVLGFWGGVWLLGALFMVRKFKRRNVSFIFTFDGWKAQQQTYVFSFHFSFSECSKTSLILAFFRLFWWPRTTAVTLSLWQRRISKKRSQWQAMSFKILLLFMSYCY